MFESTWNLTYHTDLTGSGDRQFPIIEIALPVRRRAFVPIVQVLMPSSMWALVAATIFFVKPTEENAYSRSSIATSMLVVLALHRGVCDKYVPPSPVVTMADRYIYFNLLINVGLAIWGPATTFGVMEGDTQAEHVRQTMDVCFACLLLLLSATFHIWFVYQGCRLASQTHSTLQLRKTGRAMLYRLRKRAFPSP